MKDEEKLMIKSDIVDGYIPKECCTFDITGEADDEFSCCDICEECHNDCDNCCIQKSFNRLAEYEGTGLSPEEINQIKLKMKFEPIETDERQVVYGQWHNCSNLNRGSVYKCSVCNNDEFEGIRFKYCPNCGAKMDEEVNE